MLKQEVIAQGEEFKELAKDILPLVNQIEDVLKRHGVTTMANMTADVTTGYLAFNTHANNWKMIRVNNEYPVNIQYEYSEVFALEEKTEPEKLAGEQTKATRAYLDYAKEA